MDPNYVVPSQQVWSGVYKSVEWGLHVSPGSHPEDAGAGPLARRPGRPTIDARTLALAPPTPNPGAPPGRQSVTDTLSHPDGTMTRESYPYDIGVTPYDSCVMPYDILVIPKNFRDIPVIPPSGIPRAMPIRQKRSIFVPIWQPCKPHASQNVTARTMPCQSVTARSVPANLTQGKNRAGKICACKIRANATVSGPRKTCAMQESCQGEGAKGNGAVRQRGRGKVIFSTCVPTLFSPG